MTTLRIILGDQLSRTISSLDGVDRQTDVIVMMEVAEEATYVQHHKQKLVFVFSAMRHFANELRSHGFNVDYIKLEDAGNTGSFAGELQRAIHRHNATTVIATEPGEWRVLEAMHGWSDTLGTTVAIRADTRFFATRQRFAAWAQGRKQLRMEFFYRELRAETSILMDNGKPAGDQWNFDHDNRKALPKGHALPPRRRFEPDAITREVMALVATRFAGHFGDIEPFGWAVTRETALEALDHFITACLPQFGDYQDAMKQDNPLLYHSIISPYLNIGLLNPREICERAEAAWRTGKAPLNAVEGFIRQILGWREYVRGLYWLKMPAYAETNALAATRKLPAFYWTAETPMNCVSQVVQDTRRHAYAHHIQRLMVTGNFALLAGLAPREVEEWYLLVYADAYDWVELPNTHGMALFADGGIMASKPYAASGAYINRMSDYCSSCSFDPKQKTGARACPFNYLYWDFLLRNENSLGKNPRLAMPYRNLARMTPQQKHDIAASATAFLDSI